MQVTTYKHIKDLPQVWRGLLPPASCLLPPALELTLTLTLTTHAAADVCAWERSQA
jgi:hypothetical protein